MKNSEAAAKDPITTVNIICYILLLLIIIFSWRIYLPNFQVNDFLTIKLKVMPIVKIIEVIASSEKGIDDAIRNAVAEASKTVRNIDSVYVQDIKAHVKDGKITTFGCVCKISFRIE